MQRNTISVYMVVWTFCVVVLLCVSMSSGSCADEVPVQEGARREPVLLAHYMPWFSACPPDRQWGWHWTMGHFDPDQMTDERRSIASQYYPRIGPYDSSDTHVLEYHLLLMRMATAYLQVH